jgi:hypothetical protein
MLGPTPAKFDLELSVWKESNSLFQASKVGPACREKRNKTPRAEEAIKHTEGQGSRVPNRVY